MHYLFEIIKYLLQQKILMILFTYTGLNFTAIESVVNPENSLTLN